MSLIDEIAGADVDLNDLKIGDLGIDISALGWQQTDEGNLLEVMREDDKYAMNTEECDWVTSVLDSCRRIHATAIVRLYTCKPGETKWTYRGLWGTAAIVTEADLRMACAHFIRIVDLDGFNPNSSVMLQQELYPGFVYKELTPWFHVFEMTKYLAGLSFAKEEAAKLFKAQVEYCMAHPAVDVVDEDLDAKEKSYKMVGDVGWRQADDSLSVKVARKYAGGGITDGIEVNWKKKKDLPPELAALLGEAGINADDEKPKEGPQIKVNPSSNVIDLMQDPRARSNTKLQADPGEISDGITMSWKKNTQALSTDPSSVGPVAPVKEEKKKKKKKLFGLK